MIATEPDQADPAHTYSGLFETHLTVGADGPGMLDRFRAFCGDSGVKAVLIVLPRGVTRSQPMANLLHRGTLADARSEAAEFAGRLTRAGFPVVRVKVEAAPENADIPATDAEAADHPPGHYFEFHAKLVLPERADLVPLTLACERHGAHLSANAFKQLGAGTMERFVTLRIHGVGRGTAEGRLGALLAAIAAAGHPVAKVVAEYCVLDSNIALDDGWLAG